MSTLERILQYNPTELEIKAWKICLMWEKTLDTELPDYHKQRISSRGDPRKSFTFKHCYKLAKETQGLIKDEDYKFYVKAQIQTLKSISDGKIHALIDPSCLSGDKAWRRWKRWKKNFDKSYDNLIMNTNSSIFASNLQVINELNSTKQFFSKQFPEGLDKEKLRSFVKSVDFIKLVSFNKISGYYVLLSPIVNEIYSNLDDTFCVDVEIYSKSVNDKTREEFKKMFPIEFQ